MNIITSMIDPDNSPQPLSYDQAIHLWGGKPYYSMNQYLMNTFGEKTYKLAIDGGFTCPNRDGTLGNRGCIFCSSGGSGDFAAHRNLPFSQQIEEGAGLLKNKHTGSKYIAYFQAFTNTYAPLDKLREIYTEAIHHPDVAALSIATRPDCLSEPVVSFLAQLSSIKPIWIELGLQTIHENTARYIRRGYSLSCFEDSLDLLTQYHLETVVHIILGLPGENADDMEATARYLSEKNIQGLKPQLLHVLKGTDLAEEYEKKSFHILTLEEYTDILIRCIEVSAPGTVIHRITGDGPKKLLIAPLWSGNKKFVMNYIHSEFRRRQTWQGRLWEKCQQ